MAQIFVMAGIRRSGDGSRNHPFQTISEAAALAQPGDEVLVAPGIYRECVVPARGGTDEARITYRSTVPGEAVITGAEQAKGWEPFQGDVWRLRIPNSYFGDYNPYTTVVHGDWYWADAPMHTGEVFLRRAAMYEVSNIDACLHPEVNPASWDPQASVYTWFTAQENQDTVIFANFHGEAPNAEDVEITVRRRCFFPKENGLNNITVSGFVLCRAATQWAPPTAFQDGLIGPNWARGWIIEDCEIFDSKCSGISLGKYLQPGSDNKWSTIGHKDGTQTQRDAVCQAVNEGWDKETVGSHIVRRCDIHDCGQTGIVGHMGGAFSIIEDNHIHHINNRQNLAGAEIGGIKLHAAIDTQIRRNHIHHCTRGLWLDWEAQGTRVNQNLFHDNVPPEGTKILNGLALGEDIFVEVSHGPTLIDHNLLLSDIACRISTQGIALLHNLIAGSFSFVGNGTDNGGRKLPTPRYTPYHLPHSTAIAGFMTILHGDARLYNNIFLQRPVRQDLRDYVHEVHMEEPECYNLLTGTFVYDNYPTEAEYYKSLSPEARKAAGCNDMFYDHLPVWTGGNAFFGGAKPCRLEQKYFVDQEHSVNLFLSEEDGHYTLHTNLYEYLPRYLTVPVDTAVLGMAFEPEQRFENPDGSFMKFDRDYFGRGRGIHPLCGPFEEGVQDRAVFTFRGAGKNLTDKVKHFIEQQDEAAAEIPEPEQDKRTEEFRADLTMTGCGSVSFPFEERMFVVQDIFVKGSTIWLRDMKQPDLIELDCEYGIYRRIPRWKVTSLQSLDASQDANMEGLARTIGTLLCILSKSMTHDPEDACETIKNRVNDGLGHYGITMRLTPRYLKFIRDKKFMSVEDVIYRICEAPIEPVAETVSSEQ